MRVKRKSVWTVEDTGTSSSGDEVWIYPLFVTLAELDTSISKDDEPLYKTVYHY